MRATFFLLGRMVERHPSLARDLVAAGHEVGLHGWAHRTARWLGLTPVLWTAWGKDWRRGATRESVRLEVRRRVRPGGTVLLHDSDCTSAPGSWRATLDALPLIVADVRAQGLVVGPLAEHYSG